MGILLVDVQTKKIDTPVAYAASTRQLQVRRRSFPHMKGLIKR